MKNGYSHFFTISVEKVDTPLESGIGTLQFVRIEGLFYIVTYT